MNRLFNEHEARTERGIDNRVPRSLQENFSEGRAIKEFRRTGCVTRLDAVPLRTSLKQEKRQKPVPHHRPASTGRKSSMIEFARASGAPFRLPRLGALQIWIPQ
jgi:hypothetical protein